MQTCIFAKTMLLDNTGKVLVLWRVANDEHRPGGFDFPGGGVEHGELPSAAAVRELREEAGLRLGEANLRLTFSYTRVAYETEVKADANIVWLGYIAKMPESQTIRLSHEHQRFEWLSLERAIEICDSGTQRAFLEYVRVNNLVL